MHRSGSNSTIRDNRLDLIGVWIYPCLIVKFLHVASLPSLESTVLADSLSVENIYWLLLCLCFYLFLPWLNANMFLN
jgi:hypothetical protein